MVCCAYPNCKPGQILFTPKGACCPMCKSYCETITCDLVDCAAGYEKQILANECCPKCVPCSNIRCPLTRSCPDGTPARKVANKCCPECSKPDCSKALCPILNCARGQEIYLPDGECCKRCRDDCYPKCSVECPLLTQCDDGQFPVDFQDQCCEYIFSLNHS